MYPTSSTIPPFYGLPKVHKAGAPLRPIVASRGSITYVVARRVADILAPLVGKNGYALKNNADLVRQLNDCQLDETDVLVSHDVTALFTCLPVDQSLDMIFDKLSQDPTLPTRTLRQPPKSGISLPSASRPPISSMTVLSMPKLTGRPWGRPWALSSPTSLWNGLRSQPSRPSSMKSPSGADMWMTLWWRYVTAY